MSNRKQSAKVLAKLSWVRRDVTPHTSLTVFCSPDRFFLTSPFPLRKIHTNFSHSFHHFSGSFFLNRSPSISLNLSLFHDLLTRRLYLSFNVFSWRNISRNKMSAPKSAKTRFSHIILYGSLTLQYFIIPVLPAHWLSLSFCQCTDCFIKLCRLSRPI